MYKVFPRSAKKSAMLRMDDSEDEEERNLGKPEGNKKGKLRV